MDFKSLSSEDLRFHKGKSFVGVTTCFICHDKQGNIFMAKRSNRSRDEHGAWDIGGGGLKMNVSAVDNVIREVKEEYGAYPLSVEFLGYRDAFRDQDGIPTHWVALDFLVEIEKSDVVISEPDMFDDSGWFKLDDLPKPLHSQLGIFFSNYENILAKRLR